MGRLATAFIHRYGVSALKGKPEKFTEPE